MQRSEASEGGLGPEQNSRGKAIGLEAIEGTRIKSGKA